MLKNNKNILLSLLIFSGLFLVNSCSTPNKKGQKTDPVILAKIKFDLQHFDDDGLYGPADGKRAMDYEFCIPPAKIAEVKAINPKINIHKNSRGRIGCSSEQVLCLGNTHHPNFKTILTTLAKLDYVDQIEPTYFE